MKLFVKNDRGERIYLNSSASTKAELAMKLGSEHFNISSGTFHVNDVVAETEPYYQYHDVPTGSTVGATVGAVVGLLAGPVGSMLGVIAGGLIGTQQSNEDMKKVDLFNNSKLSEYSVYDKEYCI